MVLERIVELKPFVSSRTVPIFSFNKNRPLPLPNRKNTTHSHRRYATHVENADASCRKGRTDTNGERMCPK